MGRLLVPASAEVDEALVEDLPRQTVDAVVVVVVPENMKAITLFKSRLRIIQGSGDMKIAVAKRRRSCCTYL